jgi:DNA-binding NarL/FixJ family response regulator
MIENASRSSPPRQRCACRRHRQHASTPIVKTFIVEDSRVILDKLIATLEELTTVNVVGTAADEASAVAWLKEHAETPQLMIVDIFLKSGSGLGVLRAAQAMQLSAKRVVLTNYATADIRVACEKLGADRVFDKSNQVEELLAYCARLDDGTATQPGSLN